MLWSVVKYVLTASVRDRLVISLLILLFLGISLSIFMGSAAIVERDQFALVFAGGGLRFAGVFGLVLFVVFFIRRSFETKDVEFLLSRPVGRVEFLLSYAGAVSLLAIAMGCAQILALYALGPHLFGSGHLLWGLSIIAENIIMVNAALFFSMILSSASSAAMATLALYILGRMMGQLLGIIDTATSALPYEFMEVILQVVSVITPRLDLMGQTSWLIYGGGAITDAIFIILQCMVYTALLLSAALLDLLRRQF